MGERFAPAAGDRESWLYSHELRKQASDMRKARRESGSTVAFDLRSLAFRHRGRVAEPQGWRLFSLLQPFHGKLIVPASPASACP